MTNKPTAREEFERALLGMDKDEIEDENGWWENTSGVEFGTKKKAAILSALDTFIEAIAVEVESGKFTVIHRENRHYNDMTEVHGHSFNAAKEVDATIIRSHKKV